MSRGGVARNGGCSAGNPPLPWMWPRAAFKSSEAFTEGSCQTGLSGPHQAAFRSRASSAGKGTAATRRRACRNLVSSGNSSSTPPGGGPSLSRQMRLAKPVRSAVSPCLITPMVRPSFSTIPASRGNPRYHRKEAIP